MIDEKYKTATIILRDISSKCTSEDIFQLSKTIAAFCYHEQFVESGLFFSSIINTHYQLHKDNPKNTTYQLHFENNDKDDLLLFGIGYCLNGASISIQGNVGNSLGYHMGSGKIVIEGNTKNETGARMNKGLIYIFGSTENDVGHQMYGGEIIIEKNAGKFLGERSFGGKITVKGKTEGFIGRVLNGGVIYLEGDYKKEQFAHNAQKGTIFHKGQQVFHKEKQTMNQEFSEELK